MNREDFKFEICANGLESAISAQKAGADRVELCAGIPEGGTTPSPGTILLARKMLTKTKLHVIIRPRGGDFLYNNLEIESMKADIDFCKKASVDGIVIGCLTKNGDIDIELTKELIKYAGNMSLTFHRAFDRCREPFKALEEIISLGFDRILTSGQASTAEKGIDLLAQLQQKANGKIKLLAGSGVNKHNILKIYSQTNIREYHFSAREKFSSAMTFYNEKVYMGTPGAEESTIEKTTEKQVKDTISALIDHVNPLST